MGDYGPSKCRKLSSKQKILGPYSPTILKNIPCLLVFSPLTSEEACEKSNQWLWKEKLC